MSRKFVLIGAGSHVFTRNLVRDILTFPAFADATIALVDINPKGLEYARRAVQHIIDAGHYPAKLICTTDRTEVLPGADGVLSMLMAQPLEVFRRDLEICEKYGVKINVGDTRNPAGIFRFLRTVPVMLDVLKDVQRYCPNAVFLNYTNPMAMLCRAMQEAAPEVLTTGLCHSVQHGIEKFSKILNIPVNEIEYTCAGINHLAYYLKLTHNGENLYPALRQRTLNDPAVYDEDIVRNEVFLALGYYVTESSGHFSEYSPWFRKRDDLLEKYCYRGTSWNTGRTNFTIEVREKRKADYYTDLEKFLNEPADLQRGNEYAASIFNALFGDGQLYSVLLQRQRAQLRPDRQSAGGSLRGSARSGQPQRPAAHSRGADPRRTPPPDASFQPDRGNGGSRLLRGRPRTDLQGDLLRPAHLRRAGSAGDSSAGRRTVRFQRALAPGRDAPQELNVRFQSFAARFSKPNAIPQRFLHQRFH